MTASAGGLPARASADELERSRGRRGPRPEERQALDKGTRCARQSCARDCRRVFRHRRGDPHYPGDPGTRQPSACTGSRPKDRTCFTGQAAEGKDRSCRQAVHSRSHRGTSFDFRREKASALLPVVTAGLDK